MISIPLTESIEIASNQPLDAVISKIVAPTKWSFELLARLVLPPQLIRFV